MLSRRDLLKAAGAAGTVAAFGPRTLAFAAVPTESRLVIVILRGGVDGLALAPAPGDPNYQALRRHLADQSTDDGPGNIDLDGFFGLHPMLSDLLPIWQAGELSVVHAATTGYRDRSHFDAQDLLENGLARLSGTADGWLNRALGYFGATEPRLATAVGYGTPLILRGTSPIASWAPRRLPRPDPGYLTNLLAISRSDAVIGTALAEGIRTEQRNRALLGDDLSLGRGTSTRAAIADLARAAGKLLSAKAGARIAAFDIGGWDTHGYQNIALSYRMSYLNDGLVALKQGLGAAWSNTVVVVITEFGRTAVPNGTNGTDHGTAGAALLLGGAVRGGRVVADWPGLGQSALYQGRDLMPTTDLRAVFKGVLANHLKVDPAYIERHVFPESRSIRPLESLVTV